MSQFVLDDQLDIHDVLHPIQAWNTAKLLRKLRPEQHILDDRVPEILQSLKQPTFVTIDRGFWNRRLCHPGYAILVFEVLASDQESIPALLRALLRRPEFRTRARRMGKVARISQERVDYWQHGSQVLQHLDWRGAGRRR